MSSTDPKTPPHLPYDELHEALGEHPEGRAALENLNAALKKDAPSRAEVEHHAAQLHSIPGITATVANWLESPQTQVYLKWLSDIGL
jgi:hypothetical protein